MQQTLTEGSVDRRERAATVSVTSPSSASSRPPSQREWTRVGDFMTGRYNSSTHVWSATGSSRHYPLIPVASRFIDSNVTLNPMGLDPSFLSSEDGLHPQNTHLSSRLPRRVWIILAKSLGIKLSHSDRPICATVLHIFTLLAALTFAIPGAWYTVYDIRSQLSNTTVLIGSVQLIIGLAWACMGVYAHNLAGRLLSNKNFVECVRVHSKTFMKINVSWLTLFLGALVTGVNCYEAAPVFYDNTCGTAQIEILVCQFFFVGRVIFAAVSLLWNFIVAYILFSVCRTHTVGIRRFMQELNIDAKWYEDFCLRQYHIQRRGQRESMENTFGDSWYLWDDLTNVEDDEDLSSRGVFLQSVSNFASHHRALTLLRQRRSTSATTEDGEQGAAGEEEGGDGGDKRERSDTGTSNARFRTSINEESPDNDGDSEREECEETSKADSPTLLTNEDLLFSYWKFVRRLTVTSRFLQRWLASWIAFVVMWDGYFIIYWTSHNASLVGILEFVVPLLILLLVSSAYAEVNTEGQRLLKAICPLEERMAIIFYFNQQPLAVRVYSVMVTYNAMMTVILGFSVAFASRMILDEMSRT